MDLRETTEGGTTVLVPPHATGRGPKARADEVFYNPAMALGRDIAVCLVRSYFGNGRERRRGVDATAGSGIRGLRLARETGLRMVINDANPVAVDLIRRNLARYPELADRIEVTQERAQRLLHRGVFDYIDIDPYGTPAPFLDAAAQAVRDRGLLAITATDTAVLCGAMPAPAFRRYGGRPLRCTPMHEVALRLLVAWAVRGAAVHEVAATPVFCHATDHYFRAYFAVRRGSDRSTGLLGHLRFLYWDREAGHGTLSTDPPADLLSPDRRHPGRRDRAEAGGRAEWAGPIWGGPLWDKDVLARLAVDPPLAHGAELGRLLEVIRGEAALPPLFYDYHVRCRRLRASPAPMAALFAGLRERGFLAARTHFSPLGFRSDAPPAAVDEVIRGLAGAPPAAGVQNSSQT